jgi:hypothetical protein
LIADDVKRTLAGLVADLDQPTIPELLEKARQLRAQARELKAIAWELDRAAAGAMRDARKLRQKQPGAAFVGDALVGKSINKNGRPRRTSRVA